jgi:hypothetical protein
MGRRGARHGLALIEKRKHQVQQKQNTAEERANQKPFVRDRLPTTPIAYSCTMHDAFKSSEEKERNADRHRSKGGTTQSLDSLADKPSPAFEWCAPQMADGAPFLIAGVLASQLAARRVCWRRRR